MAEAVEVPLLGAGDLDHEHVVIVPMHLEALALAPAGIEIGLAGGAELRGKARRQLAQRRMQFVDRIQDQGRAVPQMLIERRDVDVVQHLIGPRPALAEHRAADLRTALLELQPRRSQAMFGNGTVQQVPAEQRRCLGLGQATQIGVLPEAVGQEFLDRIWTDEAA